MPSQLPQAPGPTQSPLPNTGTAIEDAAEVRLASPLPPISAALEAEETGEQQEEQRQGQQQQQQQQGPPAKRSGKTRTGHLLRVF